MNTLKEVLAFHNLVINKKEEEKIEIAKLLKIDYDLYKKRIKGKEKEAELIVIMKSLGVLKHFDAFDEGLSNITDEFTSDFRIEMIDGYKMLIEVKHTDENSFKISKGNLNNRIRYAERHGLPLRFAVSIKGCWGLFTSETLQNKNGKLTINDFVGKNSLSWFDTEFETCTYRFSKKITIKSSYSQNYENGLGCRFEPFGELILYEFYCDNKLIFKVDKNDTKYLHICFLLEYIHDIASNIDQKIDTVDGVTTIIESLDNSLNLAIREYFFCIALINHTVDEKNELYNFERAIDDKKFNYIDKKYIRAFLSQLSDLGVEIIVCKENLEEYTFEEYQKKFWTKK